MKKYSRGILALIFLTAGGSNAFALTVLKNQEAAQYLGDVEKHFLSTPYTYDILSRSHRDAMHGRFSDGVIFNTGGGLFRFLKRKDGDHLVILDSADGRQEDPVNAEEWRKKISNNLSDDNNNPIIFLDESGKEMAVVFVGNGAKVDGKMTDDGHLQRPFCPFVGGFQNQIDSFLMRQPSDKTDQGNFFIDGQAPLSLQDKFVLNLFLQSRR